MEGKSALARLGWLDQLNHSGFAGDSASWEGTGWVMSRRSGSYPKELREPAVQVHHITVRLHAA
jgi:hypothetical protein